MIQPWKIEPNQKVFYAFGYQCIILRMPDFGNLLGYAGIGQDHPLFRLDYSTPTPALEPLEYYAKNSPDKNSPDRFSFSNMPNIIFGVEQEPTMSCRLFVHGGVTFAGQLREDVNPDTNLWWIGFDCAHAGDFAPERGYASGGVYRDMGYMQRELQFLAQQLRDVALMNPKRSNA